MELKKQLFKLGLLFYLEQRLRHHVVGAVIDEGLITWNHLKKQVRVPTLPCGKRRRRLPHQNQLAQEEKVAMKVEAPPKPARTSVCVLGCLTLCDPMDCSPPGSSVHGILQARILEWVACPPPGDLPDPVKEPTSLTSPALAGEFFTTWKAHSPNQTRRQKPPRHRGP